MGAGSGMVARRKLTKASREAFFYVARDTMLSSGEICARYRVVFQCYARELLHAPR
jgi:hypothetical protein